MWAFEKRSPYGVVVAPKNEEFFASDKRDSSQSLVREISQNSGDAATSPGAVVVLSFDFGEIDRDYFNEHCLTGLRPHLDACSAKGIASQILDSDEPVKFLAIEDFETTGLTGAYSGVFGGSSNFINFWRRYGESAKGGDSGGRHGIGKSTIAAASMLHFFFGATVREDDRKLLLYGQATLAPHQIPGEDAVCDPYGLFSVGGDLGSAVPFEEDAAAWFPKSFDLRRGKRPGLSLVIPFPRPEITEEAIVKAAIEHCFHQIINGHLVVRVGARELSRSTIRKHAEQFGEVRGLLAAIDLSLEATSEPKLPVFSPKLNDGDDRITAAHFSESDLLMMRSRWNAGEVVAIKMTTQILPKNAKPSSGDVFMYLIPQPDPDLARETYVRGRVTVIAQPASGKFVGLFVAHEDIVSQFLGDAEPPAHDRWLLYKVRPNYDKPENLLRRLRNSLRDIYSVVAEGEEDKPLKDALTRFFWTPKMENENEVVRQIKPFIPPPPPEPKTFEVRKISDGFVFSYNYPTASKKKSPRANFRIEVRYDVRRGAPSWDALDFDFADRDSIRLTEKGDGVLDVEMEPGALWLKDVEAGYELKVKGFDPRRDLLVNVSEIEHVE